MIWKFSGAALVTFLLFTFNPQTIAKAQTPAANDEPASTIAAALPFTPGRSGSSAMVPARTATIVVRVVDSSGVPLKRQAVVQLLSGDAAATAAPIGLAATRPSSSAIFQGLQAHLYTIEASAAGYDTARLQLRTYPHDTYYQAVLRLHPKPAASGGIPWHSWHPEGVDQEELPMAAGVVCPAQTVLDNTTQRVDELVADVNRFDAIEHIFNQDISNSGRVLSTEHRKFDYVVSINKLPTGFLAVNESRNGTDGYVNFPDQIETLGLPTLALVFHQDYRDGYQFHCEGLGEWRGQATWLMHFRQRADRAPRIRGYNIGGVLYPISLVGRAWVSAATFQIVHMEADLMDPLPKIKLRYEHQAIDYGPVLFQQGHTDLWVPTRTSLYFDFRGHKYHRIQSYSHFLLFSVTATEKISPPKQVALKHQSRAPARGRASQAQHGAGGTR